MGAGKKVRIEGQEVTFEPETFDPGFVEPDGSRGTLARVVGGQDGQPKRTEEVVSFDDLQNGDELVRMYDSEAG